MHNIDFRSVAMFVIPDLQPSAQNIKTRTKFRIFLLIYFQQDATLQRLFVSGKLLYMFRVVSPHINRSTHNCITVSGTCQTVTATCRYCGRVGTGLSVVWEMY